jgi:L-threonylcarbamoyladenylate synthase
LNKKRKESIHFNKIRKINSKIPETDIIKTAQQVIEKGGVVVFPTQHLYGLGVDAFNPEAIEGIFRIKQRSYQKPLLILIKHRSELKRIVRVVTPAAACIMDNFWPGGVTIVLEAKPGLSVKLTANTNKIGVRLPAHPVAAALVNTLKNPITGTSANVSGNAGCAKISDLDLTIRDRADLILDAGPLPTGVGSTVVDVTVDPVKILREGSVYEESIYNVLNHRLINYIDNG